jgi:glycosyltransferase involved in cell wall biosynthesis
VIRVADRRDARPFYAMADVLVHASHREGVPRVVMEAAAMGVPVVVSDIPGCREIVRPGETGVVFPARDPDALVSAIEGVLADPARARAFAARAAADVRTRFSQDAHSTRLWEVYCELTQNAGPVP